MHALTLDLINSQLQEARDRAADDYHAGMNQPVPATSTFVAIPRGDTYHIFWFEHDASLRFISTAPDERAAGLLIHHLTLLSERAFVAKPKPLTPRKRIIFDRITGDFAMYLDGEPTGYAPTYLEAETRLNQLVYSLLTKSAA